MERLKIVSLVKWVLGAFVLTAMPHMAMAQTRLEPNTVRTVQVEKSFEHSGGYIAGRYLEDAQAGDWFALNPGGLRNGVDYALIRFAKTDDYETGIEVRKGHLDGPVVGSGYFYQTGRKNKLRLAKVVLSGVSGDEDLYFRLTGEGKIDRLDAVKFSRGQRRRMQAEKASEFGDVVVERRFVSSIDDGDWLSFDNVDFGQGFSNLTVRYGKGNTSEDYLTMHLDSPDNPPVAQINLTYTGGWKKWKFKKVLFPEIKHKHKVYFKFSGGEGIGNMDYFALRNQPVITELPVSAADKIVDMSYFGYDQQYVGDFGSNPRIRFNSTSFSYNPDLSVTYATGSYGGVMEVRRRSRRGRILATVDLPPTGGWDSYKTLKANLGNYPEGIHNLVFTFPEGAANIEKFTINNLGHETAHLIEKIHGSAEDDVFEASLQNQNLFDGLEGYDQVDYPGTLLDYDFVLRDNGDVIVWKETGYDILRSIEGIRFLEEQEQYSIEEAIAGQVKISHVDVEGTDGDDVLEASLTEQQRFIGNTGVDQVNYPGSLSDYVFETGENGEIIVRKPDGTFDILDSVERVFFLGDERLYSVNVALAGIDTPLGTAALDNILVDQFGYIPNIDKVAVIRDSQIGSGSEDPDYIPGATYELINADNLSIVFTGDVTVVAAEAEEFSGDRTWSFDFSTVDAPGSYFVYDPENDTRSATFDINENIYSDILKTAFQTFIYQRSGFDKRPFVDDIYADAASHIDTGQDSEARAFAEGPARDLQGGWYDAGDFNKYSNWTSDYILGLLHAYLENPEVWGDDWDMPESGGGAGVRQQ